QMESLRCGSPVIEASEIATNVGVVLGSPTTKKSSRALPVHHQGAPRVLLRIEAQRVRRPDTSAASALSGTVKPALRQAPLAITAALSFHPATGSICQKATA